MEFEIKKTRTTNASTLGTKCKWSSVGEFGYEGGK
jgi:hypothetical protein